MKVEPSFCANRLDGVCEGKGQLGLQDSGPEQVEGWSGHDLKCKKLGFGGRGEIKSSAFEMLRRHPRGGASVPTSSMCLQDRTDTSWEFKALRLLVPHTYPLSSPLLPNVNHRVSPTASHYPCPKTSLVFFFFLGMSSQLISSCLNLNPPSVFIYSFNKHWLRARHCTG